MMLSDMLILCAVGIPMYIGAYFAYKARGNSRNVLMQGFLLVACCLIAVGLYAVSKRYASFTSLAWLGIVVIILLMTVLIGVFGVREEMRKR
jgi:predicted MFS family arabinose efflux permease